MDRSLVSRICRWSGLEPTQNQIDALDELEAWLRTEAIEAGGIGPNEAESLAWRHIADSLTFSHAWRDAPDRTTILDLGSGVGLPALPLAIVHPHSTVVAVDRSAKRARLAQRAVRILALANVEVVQSDLVSLTTPAPLVVSRAAMPPDVLLPHLDRLTMPDGVAVLGGSYRSAPAVPGFDTIEVPAEVLDRSAWLLIMARPVRRTHP